MSIKALSDYTFYSRYSQYLPTENRRESWEEAVKRVFDMHRIKYGDKIEQYPELGDLINFAELQQRKKRVLASQRSLQFAIEPIFKHNLKIFNCLTTYIDRERVFQEIMYALLCGSGVGFSVQKHHIHRLGRIKHKDNGKVKKFVVEDSIEGWADAVGVLVNSYFETPSDFKDYNGFEIEFDFSQIREEGSLIAGRFKAPGPDGLEEGLKKVDKLIRRRLATSEFQNDEFKGKLRPIDAYDIIMHISDCVLSGGVRRSATLCMFSHDDKEMLEAKIGNWFFDNPQRARSNNSAALLKGHVSREEFSKLMKSTKEFGEPGFIWVDNLDILFNPCCLPSWAKVYLKGVGVVKLEVIKEGDYIWSKEGWTKVLKKWSTGEKDVIEHKTASGNFYSTEDHPIISGGETLPINEADTIDVFPNNHELSEKTDTIEIISRTYFSTEEVFDIMVDNESHTFWCDGFDIHNCEIGMVPMTIDGRSGWSACNLTEINGKFCDTEEKFIQACEASAIIGTLQAGYTDLKYLAKESKEIFEYEALLGCSITGWMDNPDVLFDAEIQRRGAKKILEVNEKIAKMIGINPCARATCVKPAGSTSSILGTASGIHPHHARRYIRRVQVNRTEFCGQVVKERNPMAVEKSVWSANGTDDTISFLCEVPKGSIVKNQISAIDLLEKVKLTQQNWVEAGTVENRSIIPELRHNVSNTITVKPEEWGDVENYIFDNQKYFAGISLLPASGDLDYPQAPFSTILTPMELVKEYGDASVFASGLIVDGLHAFEGNLWDACMQVLGYHPRVSNPTKKQPNGELKLDWIRRVHQFAVRYFNYDLDETNKLWNEFYKVTDGVQDAINEKEVEYKLNEIKSQIIDNNTELKTATYCLKHVSLWKTWCDLKREYREIDWTMVKEEREEFVDANTLAASACAGGSCELVI